MFGWEFPPHISGGLGTACFGLTQALIEENIDLIFVVPKLHGDENYKRFRLINASDIEIPLNDEQEVKDETVIWNHRLRIWAIRFFSNVGGCYRPVIISTTCRLRSEMMETCTRTLVRIRHLTKHSSIS